MNKIPNLFIRFVGILLIIFGFILGFLPFLPGIIFGLVGFVLLIAYDDKIANFVKQKRIKNKKINSFFNIHQKKLPKKLRTILNKTNPLTSDTD